MVDIELELLVRIESYRRLIEKTRKQAFNDSECGYEGSAQFNKGQQFALSYVADDLEALLAKIRKGANQHG